MILNRTHSARWKCEKACICSPECLRSGVATGTSKLPNANRLFGSMVSDTSGSPLCELWPMECRLVPKKNSNSCHRWPARVQT
ncbi:unnamed protein product [Protopolystoma xenopodis]|uniref:Uncharacterized protein n=1 Tax=Protopolystoma xenopodis TaxID=117903 RepID=A0A3S5CEE0_9PLAT|nr:unnamed protein product [Protopolystoma xenopodis]